MIGRELRCRLVQSPGDARATSDVIRALPEGRPVFAWFRRLAALTVDVEGDVLRRALRSSRAVGGQELSRFANSSRVESRVVLPFVVAALMVNDRLDLARIATTPYPFARLRDTFEQGVSLLSDRTVPSNLRETFLVMVGKQHVRAVLLDAGYLALAARMSESVSAFMRTIRHTLHGQGGVRGFTDQWTVTVGHMVLLALLIRGQQAGGIVDFKGVKVWNGEVGNRYLWERILAGAPEVELVPKHSVFADNHASSNLEWVDGRFMDVFQACGIIADRAGEADGAILPRPGPDEPELRRFAEAHDLPPDARIVTVHGREPGFRPNERHDLRNVDIAAYLPALRRLVAAGYRVIRLGDATMTKLPPVDGVIDYAHSAWKSEALDILLPAVARFHIGSSSGLSLVPLLFGTPVLFLNWYPYEPMPWGRRNWIVVKPITAMADGRLVADRATYAAIGQMRTRPLLNGLGYEARPLDAREVERAVAGFVESLEAGPPGAAARERNLGRVLAVDDVGDLRDLE